MVTHAWFEYSYPFNYDDPSAPPTSEERDNARTYILAIIDFYTGKYGVPEDGYYDYEWRLIDGSKIGLNFDLEPETSEDVITIYWG